MWGVSGVRAVFAALAVAVGVRAGAEVDVVHGEGGELGDAQPGLRGEYQRGMVAAAVPGGAVGSGQERVEFAAGEEADDRGGGPLGLDRQDAGDQGCVLGGAQAGVTEQRADGG